MIKYPRTQHIEGSRLQSGDHDLSQVKFKDLIGKHLIIEEKIDGANCGISFVENDLMLQSRGHYLTGGPREKYFNVLKQWSKVHEEYLYCLFGNEYVMYGEWMYAKHTVYYDILPHYFMEFDILDLKTNEFLSTKKRRELIGADNKIVSVPVLYEGKLNSLKELTDFIGPSLYKSKNWKDVLVKTAIEAGVSEETVLKETNMSDMSEGLYIKVEDDNKVIQRLKFVRPDFLNSILDSETHWLNRPIIKNQLDKNIDIWR